MKTLLLFLLIFLTFQAFSQYENLNENIEFVDFSTAEPTIDDFIESLENAHAEENLQLETNIEDYDFPFGWGIMTDKEKAFWFINKERQIRGLLPFKGVDRVVDSIAVDYAQIMMDNDTLAHAVDDKTPHERISNNVVAGNCVRRWGENIGIYLTNWPVPITGEYIGLYTIYNLIYDDSHAAWGHRENLFSIYTNDNSDVETEGLIGIGEITSDDFKYYGQSFLYTKNIVINTIDPCSSWVFEGEIEFEEEVVTGVSNDFNNQITYQQSQGQISVYGTGFSSLSIFDLQGNQRVNSVENRVQTSSFENGIYILAIKSDNGKVDKFKVMISN